MRRSDGRLRFGLTDAGSVVLRGTAFVALAALIVPAFGALSALVSVVLMALLVGFVVRPKIQISGSLPDSVMAGQIVPLRYGLKNVGRLPAYNLCLSFAALPEAIEQIGDGPTVSHLGAGDTIEVTIAIRPNRRGYYRIRQPICQSVFPFNLFSFGRSVWHGLPAHEVTARMAVPPVGEEILIVLPAFYQLQIPARGLSRPVRAGGERLAGRSGAWPEYLGNRPFLPGDSPHRIDARAWARLSVPATKEYYDDFDRDFVGALVLDTAVWHGLSAHEITARMAVPQGGEELEAAISLCASVAYSINGDCLIDFLLAGPDLHQFTGWPRLLRLKKIHEILAGLEPTRRPNAGILDFRFSIFDFSEVSEVFFILLKWDAAYRQLLELAEAAGCRTRVLLIGESPVTDATKDNMNWTGDIQFLSPDEILTGRIKRL
jgi:hypothetical protein